MDDVGERRKAKRTAHRSVFVIVRVPVVVRMVVKMRVFVSFSMLVNVNVRVRVPVPEPVVRGRFDGEGSAQPFPGRTDRAVHRYTYAAADFSRTAAVSRASQAAIPSPLRVEISKTSTPG